MEIENIIFMKKCYIFNRPEFTVQTRQYSNSNN